MSAPISTGRHRAISRGHRIGMIADVVIGAAFGAAVVAAVALTPWTGPTIAGSPLPAYAACTEEDGRGPGQRFPCLWDASGRGNGQGESFVLVAPACTTADQLAALATGVPAATLGCDDFSL